MAKRKQRFTYDYPMPAVTVDVVVLRIDQGRAEVLLIRRKSDPFAGCWALPGGFVDPQETLAQAARRELFEETGIVVDPLHMIGGFGDPGRDPRGWTISNAYYGFARFDDHQPVAGDDAEALSWQPLEAPGELAFDHEAILAAANERIRRDMYSADVLRPLLPEPFTLKACRDVYKYFDAAIGGAPKLKARLVDSRVIEASGRKTPQKFRFCSGH